MSQSSATSSSAGTPPPYYKIAPNIAHEVFEGELVAVNLESGKYYAMRREAADILRLCLQQASAEEMARALASAYVGDAATIAAGVSGFVAKLEAERLVVRTDARPADSAPALPTTATGLSFAEPAYEVHDDMQDLLMLDPVHEVDAAGWPVMKPEVGKTVR